MNNSTNKKSEKGLSPWLDRVLQGFSTDLSPLWLVADPDGLLQEEAVLRRLESLGFELLPYEDPILVRSEYENRWRPAWDKGETRALLLSVSSSSLPQLPWDWELKARKVNLSLAELFPNLKASSLRELPPDQRVNLYEAYLRHGKEPRGEQSTKEFLLTHVFRFNPSSLENLEELWRELFRLHLRRIELPSGLVDYSSQILKESLPCERLPLTELLTSRTSFLHFLQIAWTRWIKTEGWNSKAKETDRTLVLEIPFGNSELMPTLLAFLTQGELKPVWLEALPPNLPTWAREGVVEDPMALTRLISKGLEELLSSLPGPESSYKEWLVFAVSGAGWLARYYSLKVQDAKSLEALVQDFQRIGDSRLFSWLQGHYDSLSSVSVTRGPVLVHQIPRFLAFRQSDGEERQALVVVDGLALDQWVLLRELLEKQAPLVRFEEKACFAWLPTLTSISRQAMFSGLRPREFSEHLDSTSAEPRLWSRFWQDQGLSKDAVYYQKAILGIREVESLLEAVAKPQIKVVGLVIQSIDNMLHGATLGKRGIATQLTQVVDQGYFQTLLQGLSNLGYRVYLTADHGNVEARGRGRSSSKQTSEVTGERVAVYRSEELAGASVLAEDPPLRLPSSGLPKDFIPLYASGRTCFIPAGQEAVVHGGPSLEELVVPFVEVYYSPLNHGPDISPDRL